MLDVDEISTRANVQPHDKLAVSINKFIHQNDRNISLTVDLIFRKMLAVHTSHRIWSKMIQKYCGGMLRQST